MGNFSARYKSQKLGLVPGIQESAFGDFTETFGRTVKFLRESLVAARVDWPKGKIDFKESSVKKLEEIKVEASHKAQGVEVFFVGARRVSKVDWGSIEVCAL